MPRTALLLLLLVASFAINGLVEPFVPKQHLRALMLCHGVIISLLCYAWAKAEALQRNTVAPGRSAMWAGLLPLIGLPIYFFRTRAPRQAVVATAKAALLLLALALVSILFSAIVESLAS